jgi:hypothetical protein
VRCDPQTRQDKHSPAWRFARVSPWTFELSDRLFCPVVRSAVELDSDRFNNSFLFRSNRRVLKCAELLFLLALA